VTSHDRLAQTSRSSRRSATNVRKMTLNKPRICCYLFATQLGSSGRHRAIRDEPFAPNSPIKQHCAERTVTGRNANNRIRKPLLYPAELRDRCGVM
jgi:hypothetical protein